MKIVPVLLFVVCLLGSAEALEMPPRAENYVNDYAGILDASVQQRIEQRLREFEKQTSNQIVVAIFPTLEDENLEDFTNRLFEQWKIGQRTRDNGVLLAIFIEERKVRIEVGYGLEGALTDALSSRIIRNEIAPAFREGQYAVGVERAVAAIEKATRGEYQGEAPDQSPGSSLVRLTPLILFILMIVFINLISRKRRRYNKYWTRNRRRHDDWFIMPGGRWGSGRGGGFGGFGGGGGFSGGGGRSGGGGASGGW